MTTAKRAQRKHYFETAKILSMEDTQTQKWTDKESGEPREFDYFHINCEVNGVARKFQCQPADRVNIEVGSTYNLEILAPKNPDSMFPHGVWKIGPPLNTSEGNPTQGEAIRSEPVEKVEDIPRSKPVNPMRTAPDDTVDYVQLPTGSLHPDPTRRWAEFYINDRGGLTWASGMVGHVLALLQAGRLQSSDSDNDIVTAVSTAWVKNLTKEFVNLWHSELGARRASDGLGFLLPTEGYGADDANH